jgi:hypothetical protein
MIIKVVEKSLKTKILVSKNSIIDYENALPKDLA